MVAKNSIGTYAARHGIPALYRHTGIPPDVRQWCSQHGVQGVPDQLTKARWSPEPGGIAGSGLPFSMAFTSPLRCLASFINHCNVAAHLEGRPFPYSPQDVQDLGQLLNRSEAHTKHKAILKALANWHKGEFSARILAGRTPDRFDSRNLTVSLFEARGTADEIAAARRAAAERIACKPHLARPVLALAAARGHAVPGLVSADSTVSAAQLTADLQYIRDIAKLHNAQVTGNEKPTA